MAIGEFEIAGYGTFQQVHISGGGTTEIVAALVGARVYVYAMVLNASAADTYDIESAADDIFVRQFAAAGTLSIFGNMLVPIFVGSVGEALNVTVFGAGNADVLLIYKQHP